MGGLICLPESQVEETMNTATEIASEVLAECYPNLMAEFGDHTFTEDQGLIIRLWVEAAIERLDEWIAENGDNSGHLEQHLGEIDFGLIFYDFSAGGNNFVRHEIRSPDGSEILDSFTEWDSVGDALSRENIAAVLWRTKGLELGKITMNGRDDFECLLCDGKSHYGQRFEIFDSEGRLAAISRLKPLIVMPPFEVSRMAREHAEKVLARRHVRETLKMREKRADRPKGARP